MLATLIDRAIAALGDRCACCGIEEPTPAGRCLLEFDHILPKRKSEQGERGHTVAKKILYALKQGRDHGFQLLCRDCNRWKSDGPFCPCRIWDESRPGWRAASFSAAIERSTAKGQVAEKKERLRKYEIVRGLSIAGRNGGQARAAALSPKRRREIAQKAARKRWANRLAALLAVDA